MACEIIFLASLNTCSCLICVFYFPEESAEAQVNLKKSKQRFKIAYFSYTVLLFNATENDLFCSFC